MRPSDEACIAIGYGADVWLNVSPYHNGGWDLVNIYPNQGGPLRPDADSQMTNSLQQPCLRAHIEWMSSWDNFSQELMIRSLARTLWWNLGLLKMTVNSLSLIWGMGSFLGYFCHIYWNIWSNNLQCSPKATIHHWLCQHMSGFLMDYPRTSRHRTQVSSQGTQAENGEKGLRQIDRWK